VSSEEEKKFREACTRDQQQMLCKIIEIYKNLLVSTLHHPEKGGGALLDERLSRLDLALRYQTTARRDFYRSLHEYWENWSAMKRASSGLSTEH
jgi:hypothetical protein